VDRSVGVLLAVIYGAFLLAVVVWSHRSAKARTPAAIDARLKNPGDQLTISATGIRGNIGIWNPAMKPGPGFLIHQPGIATYTRRHDGLIHLDWQSRTGHQQFDGSLPPPHDDQLHSNRIMLRTVLGGGLTGLSIGYLFSLVGEIGPHPDRRVIATIVGLAVALAILVAIEWHLARQHRRKTHPS
jgi:hypothetical protein